MAGGGGVATVSLCCSYFPGSLCSPGWRMAILSRLAFWAPPGLQAYATPLMGDRHTRLYWHILFPIRLRCKCSVLEILLSVKSCWVQFPIPTWWLTSICNSGSGNSEDLTLSHLVLCALKIFAGYCVINYPKKKAEREELIKLWWTRAPHFPLIAWIVNFWEV